ncbi:hypothetical protein HII12_003825 [Brettanomyces bruxellensis]|uniref:VPS9 domain-containing protein n=1 Tax=Dekkera bruxellensis TaxID=5007 RepID=A0A8H6BC95_DEKBR|nr:hypothetical protein HII12_003825 [Brettanomyces bruxellensis]
MFHTPGVREAWASETAVENSYNYQEEEHTNENNQTKPDKTTKPILADPSDRSETVAGNVNIREKQSEESIKDADKIGKYQNVDSTDHYNPETDNAASKSIESGKIEHESISGSSLDPSIPASTHITILDGDFEFPTELELPTELLKEYESFMKYLKEPQFSRPLATCEISDLFHQFYKKFNNRANEIVYGSTRSSKPVEIFSDKLIALRSLKIGFKNLDIELPEGEEETFDKILHEDVLPTLKKFSLDHSPTYKLKHLYDIHMILAECIQRLISSCTVKEFVVNTDVYLPVLIYTILHLEGSYSQHLVSQLNFIKLFTNELIYELNDETYRSEKGKFLYVLTNFEACMSYLSSVTIDDLSIDLSEERIEAISLFTGASKEDTNPLPKTIFNTYFTAIPQITLPVSIYQADQGMKSISRSVDSSIRNIMGKVPWFPLGQGSSTNLVEKNNDAEAAALLQQQLEENIAFQQLQTGKKVDDNDKITPTSSASTDKSSSKPAVNANNLKLKTSFTTSSTDSNNIKHLTKVPEKHLIRDSPLRSSLNSQSSDRFLNKFTNSFGNAMKNLIPASNSSSSLSLNGKQSDASISGQYNVNTPVRNANPASKVRSRAASMINGSLFGVNSSPQRRSRSNSCQKNQDISTSSSAERKSGLLNSLENAIDTVKNRSRGNSLYTPSTLHKTGSSISISSPFGNLKSAEKTHCRYKKFNKPFEEMTMSELKEMYQNYQIITNNI